MDRLSNAQPTVVAYGSNDHGALGTGDTEPRLVPAAVSTDEALPVACAAGGMHSALLTATGQLLTFGSNSSGQCGHAKAPRLLVPTALTPSAIFSRVTLVACGARHTLLQLSNGCVLACGTGLALGVESTGTAQQASTLRPVRGLPEDGAALLCCGEAHSAALTAHGRVFTWGCGAGGVLGHGGEADEPTPRPLEALDENGIPVNDGSGNGARPHLLTSGARHMLAGRGAALLSSWGRGGGGQLGLGDVNDRCSPTALVQLALELGGAAVAQIAAGARARDCVTPLSHRTRRRPQTLRTSRHRRHCLCSRVASCVSLRPSDCCRAQGSTSRHVSPQTAVSWHGARSCSLRRHSSPHGGCSAVTSVTSTPPVEAEVAAVVVAGCAARTRRWRADRTSASLSRWSRRRVRATACSPSPPQVTCSCARATRRRRSA